MSGNLKSVFEYELHRKLSLKAKSINSEMNLLINSFKFYDIDEIGVITKENWSKVFVRVGLTGFSENNFNELGRQAYLDSINSRQANIDKFKTKSDPILQQNDYYVSNNNY